MKPANEHLNFDDLENYAKGIIKDEELTETIFVHLKECSKCSKRLEAFNFLREDFDTAWEIAFSTSEVSVQISNWIGVSKRYDKFKSKITEIVERIKSIPDQQYSIIPIADPFEGTTLGTTLGMGDVGLEEEEEILETKRIEFKADKSFINEFPDFNINQSSQKIYFYLKAKDPNMLKDKSIYLVGVNFQFFKESKVNPSFDNRLIASFDLDGEDISAIKDCLLSDMDIKAQILIVPGS